MTSYTWDSQKKKDEINMRSSPLSIEFADGVPQTNHESTLLRVSLSQQRARDEVSRKRPTLQRLVITRALEGFFCSLLKPEVWNMCFSSLLLCFIEIADDKRCLDKSVGQTENGMEHGFVKHRLKSVWISGP